MSRMLRIGLLGCMCWFSGCIDLERAYSDCVNSNRCGAPGAGDAGDAGQEQEPDAGTDAGTDAGVPDAGTGDGGTELPDAGIDAGVAYDGGACSGSPRRKLRCDAPIDLAGVSSNIVGSALATTNQGFIAAWVGSTAEVREVHLDRSVLTLSSTAGVTDGRLALAAEGNQWAFVWANSGAQFGKCVSSADPTSPVQFALPGNAVITEVSVATNQTGSLTALAVVSGSLLYGSKSSAGCAGGGWTQFRDSVNSGAVVWTSAAGADGFRYVTTSQVNAYNGHVNVLSLENDGGVSETYAVVSLRAPKSLSAIASGNTVLTAFSEFNTNDKYTLGVFATSADFSGDGTPVSFSPNNPGWWSLGRCGAGCVGLGVMSFEQSGPAWIGFFSDDANMAPRGSWDVVCALQPQELTGSTISLAGFGGRLGVLVTAATSAKMYLCDMPPLP